MSRRRTSAIARNGRASPRLRWYLGNFELARAHLGQTLAMFDPQRDRDLTYRFGQDMVSASIAAAQASVARVERLPCDFGIPSLSLQSSQSRKGCCTDQPWSVP
jgi:hypothetical protein